MENQSNENLELLVEGCWFCKQSEARGVGLNVPLHYTVSETRGFNEVEYEYSKAEVEVPRCENCQRHHHNIWLVLVVSEMITISATILLLFLFFNLVSLLSALGWFLSIFLAVAILASISAFRFIYLIPIVYLVNLFGVNTEWRLRTYPLITAHKVEGWKIGESPIWQHTYCHRV